MTETYNTTGDTEILSLFQAIFIVLEQIVYHNVS